MPSAVAVPFSYSAPNIRSVIIKSTVWPWSTIIDNHEFGSGGPSLAKSGTCPGSMTLRVTAATPGGMVVILYGPAGSFTRVGNPCNGLMLGISNPTVGATLSANGSGVASLTFNAPPGACGRTVQGVDVGSCRATNTIIL